MGASHAPNATLGASHAPNATLGASHAPNATLGASHAPNATLGRYPPAAPLKAATPESRKNRRQCTQPPGAPTPPPTPIRSLSAVRGCLSRHLSRLDKHPRTVSTINNRGAPRNQGRRNVAPRATSRNPPPTAPSPTDHPMGSSPGPHPQ
ncbi:hypothetical protein CU254_33260 [Amycolatopsis sp. AA4]|nr:hypothetical protein CU254_33260 [Amycolatopsis sp. AA4]